MSDSPDLRMFRSATHPEFIAYVIEPALVEAELPTTLASVVAQLVDVQGSSVDYAVAALKNIITAYGARSSSPTEGQ